MTIIDLYCEIANLWQGRYHYRAGGPQTPPDPAACLGGSRAAARRSGAIWGARGTTSCSSPSLSRYGMFCGMLLLLNYRLRKVTRRSHGTGSPSF